MANIIPAYSGLIVATFTMKLVEFQIQFFIRNLMGKLVYH